VFIFVVMSHTKLNIWRIVSRKLAVILLIVVSAAGAYATLGDGKSKSGKKSSLLSNKTLTKAGTFSLKSGYTYRGSQVITNNSDKKYIHLNTFVTVQKGNTTFIVPLKKNVLLRNVTIDISNRQLHRN
jgi:hypothetical protein